MRQPSSWYASSNSCTINALLSALQFPRKLAQICAKAFQAQSSLTSRVDTNSVSRSTSRIWGPTKMPSLILASLILGNFVHRYWKAFPFLSSAFTKFFMKPSLIWRGGRRTFWADTRGSLFTLCWPEVATLSGCNAAAHLYYPRDIANNRIL